MSYSETQVKSMMNMAAELTDFEIRKYKESYEAIIKQKNERIQELEERNLNQEMSLKKLDAAYKELANYELITEVSSNKRGNPDPLAD